MEISKVCLLVGNTWGDTNRHFISKLNEAFLRRGIKTKVIDFDRPPSTNILDEINSFVPDFTCSFNYCINAGDQTFWWDFIKIPHYFMLLDPPFYSPQMFSSPHLIVSSVDRNDCQAIRNMGFANVFFLPHAVEKDLQVEVAMERCYDVVYMGTCYDYENVKQDWKKRLPPKLIKIVEDVVEIIFADDTIPIEKAFLQVWNVALPTLSPQEISFGLSHCYGYVERYTRGKDRVELIRSIKNAHVHVFGRLANHDIGLLNQNGWSHYLADCKNVTIHPSTSFAEGIEILKRSKISLNSMPFFRDGSHERIVTSLACGCFPISSESEFLREEFCAGKEIEFYQASHREPINDCIDALLNNESLRQKGVLSGREKVQSRHTWDSRVDTILDNVPHRIECIRAMDIGVIGYQSDDWIHLSDSGEASKLKVLLLIVAADNYDVYLEEQKIWRSYMHSMPNNIEAYFIKGNPELSSPFKIDGDVIWTKTVEGLIPGILNKTILAMECMLPRLHEFDFVLRTNLSSFYIFPRLLKFLTTLPKKECYAGNHMYSNGIQFCSGCGMIFSTDCVELLVQQKQRFINQQLMDDLCIGKEFVDKEKIKIINTSRMDVTSMGSWLRGKDLIPDNIFHFRCKNFERGTNYDRNKFCADEIYILSELVKKFYGVENV